MATKIDPEIAATLKKYGIESADALWPHKQSGKLIIHHWACEHIAIKAGVKWSPPDVIQACAKDKIAVLLVSGQIGERSEWSFGEAAPYNTQQSYPFAMAEKRAKDRVVLKLIGVHGKVYSEAESDDFASPAPRDEKPQNQKQQEKNQAAPTAETWTIKVPLSENGAPDWEAWAAKIERGIARAPNVPALEKFWADNEAAMNNCEYGNRSLTLALANQYDARVAYHQRSAAA
jgi:hypothetical protein